MTRHMEPMGEGIAVPSTMGATATEFLTSGWAR